MGRRTPWQRKGMYNEYMNQYKIKLELVYLPMVYRLTIVMPPPPILDDQKSRSIAFLAISDQCATLFFSQNGCRRPFWMTENHFRLHFSPFQISAQLFIFFTKWLPAAILDDRKSLSIAFLAISDQYATFIFLIFFHKMAAGGHFGWPKITFDRISRHFISIRNFFFHKIAAGGHFGWPKITFDRISRHFRSIRNFFFSQNGCRRPFWMTENHF